MTHVEVLKKFKSAGCTFEECTRHTKVITPDGRLTWVWRHTRDIPIGTLVRMEKDTGIKLR